MSKNWIVKLNQNLWEKVPAPIHSEGTRLKDLLTKYCCRPYGEKEITITLGLWLEDGSMPFKRKGLRLESPIKTIVSASIFATKSDWSVPITKYQAFLWENVERAIWGCIGTLKKKQIVVNIDDARMRHDLAQVRSEFLGVDPEAKAHASVAINGEISSDQTATNGMNRTVVQYKIKGHGSGRDHDKRVAVENLLVEFLEESDLGYCDGGDIGSGTMNVFCFVKPGKDVGKKVIELLRKNNLLEGATIAEDVQGDERVIWPPDFKGDFQLI
jgi:hypothetical protein